MQISFSGTNREYSVILNHHKEIIESIFLGGQFLQGDYTSKLEKKFEEILGEQNYATAVGSGTDGLYLVLRTLYDQFGKLNVAVPGISFIATAAAVLRAGHIPIFVDVNEDGTMNTERLIDVVENVDAILYVTLFGKNSDFSKISKIAGKFNKILVEDAAQSDFPSNYYDPEIVNTYASVLSFDPMKIFSAPGSGGMVITKDDNVRKLIYNLMYHGRNSGNWGINSQISEISACCVLLKIDYHLSEWKQRRQKIASEFSKSLPSDITEICESDYSHSLHKYVIRFKEYSRREEAKKFFKKQGIETKIHYESPLHKNKIFADNFKQTILDESEDFPNKVLTIPNYPLLSHEEVDYVCSVLSKI
jgi:UDP-2-acetamido-2-deoxy-ribo-hexuluronate aminotransferase